MCGNIHKEIGYNGQRMFGMNTSETVERFNVYNKKRYGRRSIFIKRNDFTEQKFGHLIVKETLYGYGKRGEGYCRCLCECGNECIKSAYDLRHSRNPPHCGCMTKYYKTIQSRRGRKDLTGQRFGRLVVLEMKYKDGEKTEVVCKCDCGNIIKRIATYLTSGDTTSCGCAKKEITSQTNTKDFTGLVSPYGVKLLRRSYQDNRGVWRWVCECGKCKKEFVALPAKIFNGHTTSCGCTKQSSGERYIENLLIELKANYTYDYVIKDCKNIHPLRFDFYMPDLKVAIEYNGLQHYQPVDYFGGEEQFKLQQKLDNQKREYCLDKNISLLELPYTLSNDEIKSKIINIIYPERLSYSA